MTQEKLRECARRQNRAVSFFCIVQCWLNEWDGITISRDFFERLFGLEVFKLESRLEWMDEDLREFFPHLLYDSHQHPFSSFRMITLSRHQNPKSPGIFQMWDYPNKEYLDKFCEEFRLFFADSAKYDERLLAFYLSWLAQGQISPKLIPPVKEEE